MNQGEIEKRHRAFEQQDAKIAALTPEEFREVVQRNLRRIMDQKTAFLVCKNPNLSPEFVQTFINEMGAVVVCLSSRSSGEEWLYFGWDTDYLLSVVRRHVREAGVPILGSANGSA